MWSLYLLLVHHSTINDTLYVYTVCPNNYVYDSRFIMFGVVRLSVSLRFTSLTPSDPFNTSNHNIGCQMLLSFRNMSGISTSCATVKLWTCISRRKNTLRGLTIKRLMRYRNGSQTMIAQWQRNNAREYGLMFHKLHRLILKQQIRKSDCVHNPIPSDRVQRQNHSCMVDLSQDLR